MNAVASIDLPASNMGIGGVAGGESGASPAQAGQSPFLALFGQALANLTSGAGTPEAGFLAGLVAVNTGESVALLKTALPGDLEAQTLLKTETPSDLEAVSEDASEQVAAAMLAALGIIPMPVESPTGKGGQVGDGEKGEVVSAKNAIQHAVKMPAIPAESAGQKDSVTFETERTLPAEIEPDLISMLMNGDKASAVKASGLNLAISQPPGLPAELAETMVRSDSPQSFTGMSSVSTSANAVAGPEKFTQILASTVGTPGWRQELGDKLVWMVGRQGQTAELILNPPALGSLEVRLNLSGGEAGAQFYSPHASVREAIEAALPRLRDMLSSAGLTLGEATISQHSFQQQQTAQGRASSNQMGGDGSLTSGVEGLIESGLLVRGLGTGLLDFYA